MGYRSISPCHKFSETLRVPLGILLKYSTLMDQSENVCSCNGYAIMSNMCAFSVKPDKVETPFLYLVTRLLSQSPCRARRS